MLQLWVRTFSNPLAVGPSERGVARLLRRINLQPSLALALDDRAPSSSSFLSKAAADCLELLPDRLIVAVGGAAGAAAGEGLGATAGAGPGAAAAGEGPKRLLFDVIAKHYGGRETGPLLAGRYSDVHVAIHGLLERGEEAAALKASQLCLRLLDASGRDQLRRLLAFMAQAAAPHACRLHRQIPNRMLVSCTFQKAVLLNRELSPAQSQALLLFRMDPHTRLFK
ncbi:unnamed protein product, partial [Gadus morhua 'NCC']